MPQIQLVVNSGSGWKAVDLPTDNSVKLSLYKSVQDFRDPLKATGAVSLPFTLPLTNRNRQIFNGDDDKQKLGKFKSVYQAQLLLDNEILLDGELTLSKVKANKAGFEVYLGQTRLLAPRLGDVVGDKKLTELKSMQPLAFSGNSTIADAWQANQFYPATQVCWPHVVRSFAELQPERTVGGVAPMYHSGYESLGISHYCAAIVRAIFADAGYAVAGDIFQSEAFVKLVLLYSSSATQQWNYGTLAPMEAHCPPDFLGTSYRAQVVNTYERQSDMVQVLTYGWQADAGDLCESLGADGVYTCKYSGLYTIRVSATHAYLNGAQGNGGFTAFRCISDNEFIPDDLVPAASAFSTVPTAASLDVDTLAVGGDSPFTFTVRLQEGKQYQVQRYVQFNQPTSAGSNSFLCYTPNEGNFFITACNGPVVVNQALFLPEMTQQVFLKGIFKLFNLYYQLNEDTKTVTLFGRDDFFQESLQDIVDLSRHLSLDAMDETPFTAAEVAATYVTWAPDESDYILKQTDYLTLVNGVVPTGSTELPFAPLGYMRVDYSTSTGSGTDLIPAIIPSTDIEDSSLLTDEAATSAPGSWKPRLCLYQGTGWLNPSATYSFPATGNVAVTLGRQVPATSTVTGSYTGGGYPYTAYPPKITFFNVSSQPVYEVVENQALRSFTLSGYSGSTIYSPPNPTFLTNPQQAQTLDYISLATNVDATQNPLGFFAQLYGNDLLIDSLSNYLQGVGRMDSVLWNRLTGRQVLRVAQDLFLLDSIQNFDVNQKLATYRLYKLVSNSGVPAALPPGGGPTSGGTIQYTSTMTATASCPTNTSGDTKTATATRSSYNSQAEADQKAYQAALQVATAQLVCTRTAWVGHGVAAASCQQGQAYGYDVQASATHTSTISQADADQQAQAAAEAAASAKLVCHLSPVVNNVSLSNLIASIQGDFTAYPDYSTAQAYDFTNSTYYYAFNQQIIVGNAVYVQSGGYYYALQDGYYPFRYTSGPDLSVQGFQIVNGVVDNYIDTVQGGATGP